MKFIGLVVKAEEKKPDVIKEAFVPAVLVEGIPNEETTTITAEDTKDDDVWMQSPQELPREVVLENIYHDEPVDVPQIANAKYEWYRSRAPQPNKLFSTESTYTPKKEDVGQFIRVEITLGEKTVVSNVKKVK